MIVLEGYGLVNATLLQRSWEGINMIWIKSQDGKELHECSGLFLYECSIRIYSADKWQTVGKYDTLEIAQEVVEMVWRVIQGGGKVLALPTNSDGTTLDKIDVTSFKDCERREISNWSDVKWGI
jgi:hypothetical protein